MREGLNRGSHEKRKRKKKRVTGTRLPTYLPTYLWVEYLDPKSIIITTIEIEQYLCIPLPPVYDNIDLLLILLALDAVGPSFSRHDCLAAHVHAPPVF